MYQQSPSAGQSRCTVTWRIITYTSGGRGGSTSSATKPADPAEQTFGTKASGHCPSAQWLITFESDDIPAYYAYNGFGVVTVGDRTNALDFVAGAAAKESEVVSPADMMAIGDSFDSGLAFMRTPTDEQVRDGNILTRHRGKVNVALCDGHVESPTLRFVFDDTSDAALVRWNRDHLPHRE